MGNWYKKGIGNIVLISLIWLFLLMIAFISFPFGDVSLFWSIQLLAFFITFFQSKDFLEIFFKGRFASWAVLSHFFYPARPRTNWVGNSTLPYLSVEGHYHCCKCSLSVLPIHISIQTHGHIVMSRDFFLLRMRYILYIYDIKLLLRDY